jgi:hypothetical protein
MVSKWKIIVTIGVLWLGTIVWGIHALLRYKVAPGSTAPQIQICNPLAHDCN